MTEAPNHGAETPAQNFRSWEIQGPQSWPRAETKRGTNTLASLASIFLTPVGQSQPEGRPGSREAPHDAVHKKPASLEHTGKQKHRDQT